MLFFNSLNNMLVEKYTLRIKILKGTLNNIFFSNVFVNDVDHILVARRLMRIFLN